MMIIDVCYQASVIGFRINTKGSSILDQAFVCFSCSTCSSPECSSVACSTSPLRIEAAQTEFQRNSAVNSSFLLTVQGGMPTLFIRSVGTSDGSTVRELSFFPSTSSSVHEASDSTTATAGCHPSSSTLWAGHFYYATGKSFCCLRKRACSELLPSSLIEVSSSGSILRWLSNFRLSSLEMQSPQPTIEVPLGVVSCVMMGVRPDQTSIKNTLWLWQRMR